MGEHLGIGRGCLRSGNESWDELQPLKEKSLCTFLLAEVLWAVMEGVVRVLNRFILLVLLPIYLCTCESRDVQGVLELGYFC